MEIRLYNSLTKTIEPFKTIEPGRVRMYTCGPTVYDFITIGNHRTFFLSDLVYRTLTYAGYNVDYIMNLTDVGHLFEEGDTDQAIAIYKKEKKQGKLKVLKSLASLR